MPPKERNDEHDVDRLLARLAQEIGERRFKHWFQGKTRLTLDGDLLRVDAASRERVYDRIAALSPPPASVVREKVLQLDAAMLKHWREELAWTW